jgi:hypothetical protein
MQRCAKFANSERAVEIIDKGIEKFMGDLVSDAFSTYGEFSKTTKEAFKAALPGNIDSVIDLSRYNAMIEQRLRDVFATSGIANDMVTKAESALKEAMDETLLPPIIKLSTLIEAFIDDNAEYAAEEQLETPDLRFKEDDRYGSRYVAFFFDREKKERSRYSTQEHSEYSLKNHLHMRAIDGELLDGHQVYEVYSATIDEKLIQCIVTTNCIRSKWEKMMFALFYGQSKICIDCDPDDYSYPCHD